MRFAVVALCILASPVPAQTGSDYLSAFSTGVICPPETTGERSAPGTVAGVTHTISEQPPFVSRGDRVPAVIGIGFGVKATSVFAEGLPVTMVVTHPPMGPDQVTRQEFNSSITGDDLSLTFYQFDYDYELLEGTWTLSAMSGETMIYSTTFQVVPPRDMPELAGICGFENLLS